MGLWNDIVYGPIRSRRLGVSLGVNLSPVEGKVCTFNCIYCECGWNKVLKGCKMPSVQECAVALEERLKGLRGENAQLDVITFAGNGEPTLHPHFAEVVDVVVGLRDRYFPAAKVSALSNATRLGDASVVAALHKVDNNILKLDSAIETTWRLVNQPNDKELTVAKVVEGIAQFSGECVVQTLFFKGEYNGYAFDNSSDVEVAAWLEALQRIRPREVMIYSLDRATPAAGLERPTIERLREIAARVEGLGIKTSVTG